MAKGIKLNREQYKNVKRMDHKQMETFVVNMYNAGYEDGKKTAGSRVKPSDIAVAISEIKGIGTKKAAEIMAAVNKLYEGGTKPEELILGKRRTAQGGGGNNKNRIV